MSKHIFFVTTNAGKFEEVQKWLAELDSSIILEQAPIDLPEYQSLDIQLVALGKVQEAWRLLSSPVLIDDGGIYLERYNQFPGTLSKYVYQGIGLDGIWKLAQDDPRAYFLSCLVYKKCPEKEYVFEGISKGHVIKPEPNMCCHQALPYTKIFIPEGYSQTMAQLRGTSEEKHYHHRFIALKNFVQWLND